METTVMLSKPEAEPIPAQVSLRKAAERIGVNRQYLKGYIDAIGVRLVEIGPSLVMNRRDFERLEKRLAKGKDAATL